MAAHVRSRMSAAARLRGTRAGAFLGTARALSANVCGRQYAGRKLYDACQLLPHPAPAAETRDPKATDPDDAEITASPQACSLPAGRIDEWHIVPPVALGRCTIVAEREDQARLRRQNPPGRDVLGQGLFRPLR